MRRSNLFLIFAGFLVLLATTGLAVRFLIYPLFADRLPWPVDTEDPDEELPVDPGGPAFGIESTYQVHFIDTGNGESIFVKTPSKNVLINGGQDNHEISAFLHKLEIDTLNLLIVTHPHAGNIGGLPAVLRQFHVLEIVDPGIVHSTQMFTAYLELADSLNTPFTIGSAGLERDLGDDAYLILLQPSETPGLHPDNSSITTRLQLKDLFVFIAGSSDRTSETEWLSGEVSLESQVMKVGSYSSVPSDALLNAVKPETAIIFCSKDKPNSSPDPLLLQKMYQRNIAVYQTFRYGTVTIHTDGEKYYIETETGGIEKVPGQGSQAFTRVDLNTADYEDLLRIIHIGPARAQQIMAMRPVNSLDDLIQIPGIDNNRLEEIKKQNLAFVK